MSFTETITDRAADILDRRSSRRGFLSRTAVVGSAFSVAGPTYVLRPTSAYAAVCSCLGRSCDCGSLCCDGYTEFCCAIYGQNSCPTNTILAGWWKVDNSHFCNGAARYYMDCNKRSPNCGCGAAGVCRGTDTRCQCRSCGNRKDGCTTFRYGNCNNHVTCVGPIMCRVVTCSKPWELDPGCSTVARTDNNTRYHHRPCLDPPPVVTERHRAIIRAHYHDYLQRGPSASEVDGWAKQLAAGRSTTKVSLGFAKSVEYVSRFVRDTYLQVLDRSAPTSSEVQHWTQQIRSGMAASAVTARFFSSEEFFVKAGGTDSQFVDMLYRRILGREPDGGRQHWIDRLARGESRLAAATSFLRSVESRKRRVHALYQRFLGRNADPTGLDRWTRELINGDDLALATFLTGSVEYGDRALRRYPDGS